MKYIITSGPMEMNIDRVRKIQNSSSGRLGATVVKELFKAGISDVVYIHTAGAIIPNEDCIRVLIDDHQQLLDALESELTDDSVVVHAMAISDFYLRGTLTQERLAQLIIDHKNDLTTADDVQALLAQHATVTDKLASDSDQVILINRSIKVIDQIKQLNPNCKLIGFKLLSNVSEAELLTVGRNIWARANCDYVVANLKEEVSANAHHAYIIGADSVIEAFTKEQIAKKIIELMEE